MASTDMTALKGKVSRLEELTVSRDEKLADIQHRVNQLLPTPEPTPPTPDEILTSYDPEVIAAQKFIAKTDEERITADKTWMFPTEKYNAAKRLVSQDLLTRCVFEMDGQKYQITVHALKIKGAKYTAPEMMKDPRILRYLVAIGSSVKQLS